MKFKAVNSHRNLINANGKEKKKQRKRKSLPLTEDHRGFKDGKAG